MSSANPLWGAPRIHGELLKLGIEVSQATVGRYLPRRPKAPSPTWRSFLRNHLTDIAAVDMFIVATATFRILYTLIVLDHHRRNHSFRRHRKSHATWLSRQITEAFPWDTAPRYLLRDRDASYGLCFQNRVRAMGIEEVLTAPRSPWQNPYAERIIGSIRRDCLDHVIIFNETHLRRVLSCYFRYYHGLEDPEDVAHASCPRPLPPAGTRSRSPALRATTQRSSRNVTPRTIIRTRRPISLFSSSSGWPPCMLSSCKANEIGTARGTRYQRRRHASSVPVTSSDIWHATGASPNALSLAAAPLTKLRENRKVLNVRRGDGPLRGSVRR